MTDAASLLHTATYHGLLGTVIDLRVRGQDSAALIAAEERAIAEVSRLQRVFSAYDPASELCRWRVGQLAEPGAELGAVLVDARDWQVRSDGAFNPLAGALTRRWQQAEAEGVEPGGDELGELVGTIREPAYAVEAGGVRRTGDCRYLDLNAFAKGHIVDRAVAATEGIDGVASVVVNAGGDLVHRGVGSIRVGVENPHRVLDNEPPVSTIELANGATATSGSTRRGFTIGGRRFSHVLDPRTGYPVETVCSATVTAPDAATADVVATIVGVMNPPDAIGFAEALDGVECLLIGPDGHSWRSSGWVYYEDPRRNQPLRRRLRRDSEIG